jgi:hypothetical protein
MTMLWIALIVAGLAMTAFAAWPGKRRTGEVRPDRPDEH